MARGARGAWASQPRTFEEERMRMTSMSLTFTLVLGACVPAALAAAEGTPSGPVAVKPPAAVTGKAAAPAPPAKATKKTTVGKGKAAANTANPSDDGDASWVEELDIDGDGTVETADLLWD